MKVSNTAGYEARLADVVQSVKDVLRRRYLTLAAVAGGITILGVVATLQLTPSYQGVTRIQIDPSRNPLARSANEAQAQLASEAIETEVSVINSMDISRGVVKRLKLIDDADYNKGIAARLENGPVSEDEKIEMVANAIRSHLSVGREKLTYIIAIRFDSRDAEKAARIANAYAATYLDTKVGTKIGTAERQSAWFQKRMDELAAEVRSADEKVAQYQSAAGIVRGASNNQGTITDQQVGPLSVQLASAESVAAEARSKQISAQQQVASGHLDAVSDVRNSATIQDLRRQRGLLVQNMGEMQMRYGDRYPDLIKVRDQLAAIDGQLREEAGRVIRSLKADADAAEARAGSLRVAMQRLEDKQSANARASVIAASMQRDADSKHQAYDRLAQSALESRQAAQNSIAQAQIIDVAEAPQAPYWPNKPLFILLSLIIGTGAGIAVITAQEMMVSGMRTVEDVEGELGVPLIAAVPNVRKTARPADVLIEKPTSQFAEALRNARASILGVKGEEAPKVIALTSALPGEGKTTTALGLARTMALNGGKTILVDADVRRAQLRQIADVQPGPGIVELLHGEASLEQAIQPSGLENLDQIIVQKPYFSSENLFGNDLMPGILDELSKRYDTIILDLPPLVGLADGRFLAALADAVVLAIKWDATPSQAVSSAASWLKSDGANLVGALFTMVDTSSQSVGAYYYYSKKYSSYYQAA
ncbi:GumC family protein [Sphingobium yanoikuyae]|uniref:GumC family protein n=1 Tax=Sphingobium yanoikuyae TaxID=13690 RepID=UPI00293CAEA9|nr:polysaccharide biosynthesis tyrosine autokinase [Sphingobium yanoikuyae]MDV3482267.1 polysaccharide biosynthesis tyrosine autokinase [Sphingobium yanoikuyae]